MWALKAVAKACGKRPTDVLAHPEYLRVILKEAAPESVGLGRAVWNNARSLFGKALAWAGFASIPAHYMAPLAPAWLELRGKLPAGKNALRFQLDRLFHYCSAQRIGPDEVNDDVLTAFHHALVTESIVKQPYEIYRGAAKSWNNAVERIAGWPQQRLTVPSRARVFSEPWGTFPPTLRRTSRLICAGQRGWTSVTITSPARNVQPRSTPGANSYASSRRRC
jgi:hypothetical protein